MDFGHYIDLFINGYSGYAEYLWKDITHPSIRSYFYWLIGISLFFFMLEVLIPWRKKQSIIRKDFWLDAFYMFFNFFLFSLIIYNAASDVVVNLFNDGILSISGFDLSKSNPMQYWPAWSILIVGFLLRDFVQWWVHRLLHFSSRLWNFHKVHHSVEEMGFAAHLRYHWMENVIYRTIEYIPLALMGIGLHDFFIIHIFTVAWGHYNHSNISIGGKVSGAVLGGLIGVIFAFGLFDLTVFSDVSFIMSIAIIFGGVLLGAFVLGPIMPKLFNSPEMHLWHHAHDLPKEQQTGINFGITLAIWDYIFGTDYIPDNSGDIKLGFPGVDEFPEGFIGQSTYGIK
ncbi:MAG: sterol desaturase family protein [Saprospiraceae bacterium]